MVGMIWRERTVEAPTPLRRTVGPARQSIPPTRYTQYTCRDKHNVYAADSTRSSVTARGGRNIYPPRQLGYTACAKSFT